jgi:hypothetical protein
VSDELDILRASLLSGSGELHITRASQWTDAEQHPITRAEWESFAEAHPKLSQHGSAGWKSIEFTKMGRSARWTSGRHPSTRSPVEAEPKSGYLGAMTK